MSQLKITSAGIAYKNDVFAGSETLNITKMVFAHVPGLNADSPILNDSVPANIVHNQPIDRVSSLDGDAVVISSVLGYDVGNFTFNWFGAIAKKANGTEVLIAIVHTNEQTKTRTDGANTGDYSVKSIIWRSQQLAGDLNVTLPTLPWQVNDGVFATKSDIESLEQYIKDAGLGTQISHQSENFFDRTFELRLGAGESKPFPDLPDTACDILIFGLTDGTSTSTNFVGRFAKYGSTWSANTIYGNTNGPNHPSIKIIDNVPTFSNPHGSTSYPFAFKCWIATQSGGNAKPFEFFANTYSTYNKPTPADIGAVAKGESINLADQDIIWSKNTDGAKIGFKNDADSDADSYLFFETSDNSNEYFKWQHRSGTSYSEWMSLNKSGISTRNATFDNGTNTTVNIQADDGGRAVLNIFSPVAGAQSTGTAYVGQSPSHGGGIEYNGDNSPATTGAGSDFFTLFRRENGTEYWTARNFVSSNDWEFRGNVEVNGDLKMIGSDCYIWTPNTETGFTGIWDTKNGLAAFKYTNGQGFDYKADIKIVKNNPWLTLDSSSSGSYYVEQAAGISIGESGKGGASIHMTYIGSGFGYIGMGDIGSDSIPDNWAMQLNYQQTWVRFRSEIHLGDDKTKLFKNDSDSLRVVTPHGNVDIGPKNHDWCHFDTSLPKFHFGKPVHVRGEIYAGSNYNQRVYHEGYKPTASDIGGGTFNGLVFAPQSKNWNCSLSSTSPNAVGLSVWSDTKQQKVGGVGVYSNDGKVSGSNFAYIGLGESPWNRTDSLRFSRSELTYLGKEVLHAGNIATYLSGERRNTPPIGELQANSKNHLITSNTFTLPPFAETPEDAVIVVSKRLSATPLIKANSPEKIIMTRRGRVIEKNEVLFDANCTLTFILNDEGNWEMHI
ncbi:phage tail protein [Pseudoalteromonas sp. DY56-GL79]|uniref:phage tail-collar fiber domain-containing protein n=1 Tax=Pseudoalteromonas sp. DY56-GL79 TaxID=2967131 RepID=UPI00352A99F4